MPSPRRPARLSIAGLLASAAVGLGWLLLVFAGDRTGRVELPAGDSIVEYFADPGKRLTRDEAGGLAPAAWRSWQGGAFLSARQGSALWLRVTLHNPGDRPAQGVLVAGYPFVDHVDAWVEGAPPLHSGETVPPGVKALWGRDTAFPITVPARGVQVVWLRADDFFRPFLFPAWWPDAVAFHVHQARSLLAEGIYLGGLLAMLGYNTILWLRLRIADIGCYVLYLGSAALVMCLIRAYPAALGWPLGSPAAETLLTLALALSGVFLTQFAREFLELKTRVPQADRLARGLRGLMMALAAGALVTPWLDRPYGLPAAVLGLGVTHLGLLAAAAWAWRRGVRQARLFGLSFACLIAGALFLATAWLGETSIQDAAAMSLMMGSALEMLMLSLAVADRFVTAQRARAAAQARLVEETEQRRAVEEAYADELAVEVRERTRELAATNADQERMLAVIGHDLRSPLTGLTRTAEQLARWPVARGELEKFAADTAVLGGETLLLIEDLVLWARLRAGLGSTPRRHFVRALVAPVAALHRSLAEQRHLQLVVTVPDGLCVATDLVLAQTLLRNLVANALKFAGHRVVVAATAGTGGVRFAVCDDGPGLPAAVAAALAQDRPGPAGAEGGLGLRLCADLSHVLGAQLAAQPLGGGGTEFTFVLPVADEGEAASP